MANYEEIYDLRKEELKTQYEYLKTLSPDSEEYGKVISCIDVLTKQVQADFQGMNDTDRVKQEKLDILLRAGGIFAGIAVPAVLKFAFGKAAFKFEENGTISTFLGKIFLNGILRDR
jgi:hypothetical protein